MSVIGLRRSFTTRAGDLLVQVHPADSAAPMPRAVVNILDTPNGGMFPVIADDELVGYLRPHRLGWGRRITYWSVFTVSRTRWCAVQSLDNALRALLRHPLDNPYKPELGLCHEV